MSEEVQQTIMPVRSPWGEILLDALRHVEQTLLIVSPYIKGKVVVEIQEALLTGTSQRKSNLHVRIITRVDPDDLLNGSSDIAALQRLLTWSDALIDCTVEMRALSNVHAKVWICDARLAIVGSGNATPSGLEGNLEYGLAVYETEGVERILNDWQVWWDQAERVEMEALDRIAGALEQVRQSEAMRQSQAQRAVIQQALKTIPSLGKRITFKKDKRPASPMIKEQPKSLSTDLSDEPVTFQQASTLLPLEDLSKTVFVRDAITLPVIDFWRALNWVIPFAEDIYGLIDPSNYPNAFLKIFWKATPSDHQELRLIWADGKRYSQASLLAHRDVQQQSWTITLNLEQLCMFGEMLRDLKKEQFFTKNAEQSFSLSLQTEPYIALSIAYLLNPANLWSGRVMLIPCVETNFPGNFPVLRAPLSRLTVSHEQLQAALTALKQEWESIHTSTNPLTIIEVSITVSGENPMLTLSTGQIEAPITRSFEGTNGSIVGSEISVRLDGTGLQQVLNSAPGNVERWQLWIDRNADAVQFIPEPDILSDAVLVWKHELRAL